MSETEKAHVINRSSWPPGPWDVEPDKLEWRDEKTGMPCLIVRSSTGHLCGYVGVPPGHRFHGVDYLDCAATPQCVEDEDGLRAYCEHRPDARVSVHGGLTYAAKCAGAICHVAKPGEPDDVWWLGFDCAHSGDEAPGYALGYGTYKTVEYVRTECAELAAQLEALSR